MIPVADQFEDIRKRRDEIAQNEGKSVPEPVQPPADTEQPRMEDYACGYGKSFLQALVDLKERIDRERIRHMNEMIFSADWCNRTPGEFTDGA